jgi:outer membrane protein OmpA-like peptidoglycan-associated protein
MPVRKSGDTRRDLRLIPGRVIDRDTRLSLPGSTVEYSTGDGEIIGVDLNTEGRFAMQVIRNKEFKVQAKAPGYQNSSAVYLEKENLREVVVELKKGGGTGAAVCPGDAPQCIDNLRLYFDLNSAEIKKDQEKTLDAIAQILLKYPDLNIEIQGHTDRTYRGPAKDAFVYNQKLSEMRAKKIHKYLTDKSIDKTRLAIRGYSFTQPREKGKGPNKEALNRRVEFRRIKK